MSSSQVICPECRETVESEDALQQHCLTSCPGYDADQPRSKLTTSRQQAYTPSLSPPPQPRPTQTSGQKQYCSVKFMWQPLTEITYPKVTLLAAFENGSVDLLLDSEGGHYESSYINTEKGKFEGQLVIADSFVYPVSDFTIEKDDVIVLQIHLPQCTGESCPHCQGKRSTREPTGQPGGVKIYYFYTPQSSEEQPESFDLYQPAGGPSYDNTSGTGRFTAPKALDSRSYDGRGRGRGYTSPSIDINEPNSSLSTYQSTNYQRTTPLPSTTTTTRQDSVNQVPLGNRAGRGDPSYVNNSAMTSVAPLTTHVSMGGGGGWSSDRLQSRAEVRTGGDQQEQLRKVQEEKVVLEERARRLEGITELQARRGAGGEGTQMSQLLEPGNQLSILMAEEKQAREKAEQDLKESKDRIAALENQMEEYASAMKDQSSAIQGAMASNKTRDAEMQRLQHQCLHLTQYAQKQQAEYGEGLNTVRKKADKMAEENVRLQQLNVALSAEVEECRTRSKRLLEDLRQKEDDIIHLQERTASSSNPGVSLELETMRQKYEVWKEEASKVSPLLEEVEELREQNRQLEATVAQLKATPPPAEPLLEQDGYSRKSSEEYDRLMERCMELQATRVKLENELGPLREERAATLQQLSQLREMVKHPEWYEKLKEENAALKEQCGQLQESLQAERGNTQRQKEANKQLTQKLQDSTNPEQLQAVKERLERYRQERDTSRQQVEELQKQLEQLALTNQQRQSEVLNSNADRSHAEIEDDRTSEIESEVHSKVLEDTSSLSYNDAGGRDNQSMSPSTDDLPAHTSSQADVNDSPDHPTVVTAAQTNAQANTQRPSSQKGGTEAGKPSPARSQSITSSEQQLPVQVNTKSGTKSMVLCKLTDPKKGMKVIVKRSGPGEYDAGTIRYVGKVEGASEDYAGIELDLPKCPSGRTGDGTFKGKHYFKCTPGYGIYLPLAKVYVEQR